MSNLEVFLDIKEVRKPEVEARLVAENIASQLEKRISFRRAMKKAVHKANPKPRRRGAPTPAQRLAAQAAEHKRAVQATIADTRMEDTGDAANAVVRGSVVAPKTFGGVPQLPTIEEYALARDARKTPASAGSPSAIAKGGTIIADAYTSV